MKMLRTDVILRAILLTVGLAVTAWHPAAATSTSVSITTFRGPWVSTSEYTRGEVVTYAGVSYICRDTSTNVLPNANTGDWAILAAQLSVYDANNHVVGQWLPDDQVLVTSLSGPFLANINVNGFIQGGGNIYFAATNCSGTPYANYSTTLSFLVPPAAVVLGTDVYILSSTGSPFSLAARAELSPIGCGPYSGSLPVVPVTVANVSGFVPPFSVH